MAVGPPDRDPEDGAARAVVPPRGPDRRAGGRAVVAGRDDLASERDRMVGPDDVPPADRRRRGPAAPWQVGSEGHEDEVEDGDEEEPRLRRRFRLLLHGGVFALWALAMLAFGIRWWNFEEHGPWLTPVTPLLLGGALEQAILGRRPDWARDAEPDPAGRPLRGAAALGDRARPYWARPTADDGADQ